MDLRGIGVGIAVVIVGSIGMSYVIGSILSILIPYPLASPANCKTNNSNAKLHRLMQNISRRLIKKI